MGDINDKYVVRDTYKKEDFINPQEFMKKEDDSFIEEFARGQEDQAPTGEYKHDLRGLIEDEVQTILNEELVKAKQELITEHRKAITQLVEEQRTLIRELVAEEKKAIWDKASDLKKSLISHLVEESKNFGK